IVVRTRLHPWHDVHPTDMPAIVISKWRAARPKRGHVFDSSLSTIYLCRHTAQRLTMRTNPGNCTARPRCRRYFVLTDVDRLSKLYLRALTDFRDSTAEVRIAFSQDR